MRPRKVSENVVRHHSGKVHTGYVGRHPATRRGKRASVPGGFFKKGG